MKVAWVCEYPPSSFSERRFLANAPSSHPVPWVALQAPLVAALGVDLHIVTVSKHIEADDEFTRDGVQFHFLKIPRLPRVAAAYQIDRRRIVERLRRLAPNVVEGFGTESSYGYAAVVSGYPAVVMIQGIMAKLLRARGIGTLARAPQLSVPLLMERLTIRRGRHFVCETAFAAGFVREHNPRAVVHTIKSPIRDDWFEIVSGTASVPEILFIGWVTPEKGIEVLLSALPRIVAAVPGAMLHVVGPYEARYVRDRLTPRLAQSGLEAAVRFHGYQSADAIAARLSTAAVVALPTLMDTAPNVLAEARAAGVPVVASAVGGVPELVDDGVDGVLVPPGSSDALAAAIEGVLRDPARARRLRDAGRARVQRDHRLATQVPKLVQVYRDVLDDRAAPEPRT